jgi:3-oxoadipate enol-lactonase
MRSCIERTGPHSGISSCCSGSPRLAPQAKRAKGIADEVLGHELLGTGAKKVVILNDWVSCTSSWQDARRYLDTEVFSFAFVDVRGYGRSKSTRGDYTIGEVSSDVLAVAKVLGWSTFSVVGHSVSTLAALDLAQHARGAIERLVLVSPVPVAGLGMDESAYSGLAALALGDDAARAGGLSAIWGDRLGEPWLRFKLARWRECADPQAVLAYGRRFACEGLPDSGTAVRVPVLAVTGEQDGPPMRRDAISASLAPLCSDMTVVGFADCAHYPMQEAPPLLAATLQAFLAKA